jgi:hypothetical protein
MTILSEMEKSVWTSCMPEEEQRNIKTYVAKMARADGNTGMCGRSLGILATMKLE